MRVAFCALLAGLVSACAAAVAPPVSAGGGLGPQSGTPPAGFTTADSSGGGHLTAAASTSDSSQSGALTDYLKTHRLPLVGAQVLNNSSGVHQVILYGFVATQFGKQDAEAKARQFLGDPTVEVVNRIDVRPELLASGNSSPAPTAPSYNGAGATPPSGNSTAPDNSQLGSIQGYQDQQAQAQQYQQAGQQGGALTALLPLLGMVVGSVGIGGGGFGMGMGGYPGGGFPGGGMFGSPYSPYAQPYAPYPPGYGYPSSGFSFGGGGYPFP